MADVSTTQLANRLLDKLFGLAGNTAQSMSFDNRSVAFQQSDTTLGSPSSLFAVNFATTPTAAAGGVINFEALASKANAQFVIRRWAIHASAAGSVTGTSSTLLAGSDTQSIDHSANEFDLRIKGKLTITPT